MSNIDNPHDNPLTKQPYLFGFLTQPLRIHFPEQSEEPFDFTVTVNFFWGYVPPGAHSTGPLPDGASFRLSIALYNAGGKGITINDDGSLNFNDAVDVQSLVTGTEEAATTDGHDSFGMLPPGGSSVTLNGVQNGPEPDQQQFVMWGVEQIDPESTSNISGLGYWGNYTATAFGIQQHIPGKTPGVQLNYPGVQSPTYAPSTITIGGPTPPQANTAEAILGTGGFPPEEDPGDLTPNGFPFVSAVNVDFLGINPNEYNNQEL